VSDLSFEMLRRMENRYSVDSNDMSMGDWICQNTNLRGRPFNFKRYPFQEAIANDMHPNMDVIKPSQVGLTEIQIRKALAFVTRNRQTNLIFTLPSDAMFERMSATRILPLVKEEPVFNLETRSGEKPTRSKGLIQVGGSFVYVTGAKEGDATSISADVVFNDEIDLTNQQMLTLFNSRLQNSDWKINQRFSTPTFVNYAVDQGYQLSDQREYMCRCESCNHWNIPLFDQRFVDLPGLSSDIEKLTEIDTAMLDTGKLDLVNAQVICERCRAPLDLGGTSNREWIAKYESRTTARGYRVRPFSTSRLSVEYIVAQMIRYKSRDFMRGWHNTVLGEAFTDGNARLSPTEIEKCFSARSDTPRVDPIAPTWIGIDMGRICHLVLSQGDSFESQQVLMFRAIPVDSLIEEVELLLKTYNVIGGACDRHPYTPTADHLCSVSNGKILPVEYRGAKDFNLIKSELTEEVTHAQAGRTKLIDEVARVIRLGRVSFSGYGTQKTLISDHLQDMVRDETPEKPATWVKLTGNDHYFHALAFLAAGIKLKEWSLGTQQDKRSHVEVENINIGSQTTSLFGIDKRAQRGIW
jgi:hypothetical protein